MHQQIWKTQQGPRDWKRSVYTPTSKEDNAKECSNYWTNVLISRVIRVMLNILQPRLEQYMNQKLPDVQAGFRKGEKPDQITNIQWIIEKAREFRKKNLLLLHDYSKAIDCVDKNKLWKILKEMGIPDHITCLLRNLYAGLEATLRTGQGSTN